VPVLRGARSARLLPALGGHGGLRRDLKSVDSQLQRILEKAQHCRLAASQARLLPERGFLAATEIATGGRYRRLQSDDRGIALDVQLATHNRVGHTIHGPQVNAAVAA